MLAQPLDLAPVQAQVRERSIAIPWYCLAVAFGATFLTIGILWDISWHSTIGRDTFWTPAHLLIHAGGLLGGLSCGWLVLKTTFWGTPEERDSSVRLWGFRGPLGAWVCIWGAIAMLTSAPFDDWWHSAYGLDVEILSPPHTVLALGMYGLAVGALLLILAWQNRSSRDGQNPGSWLFVYVGGVLLTLVNIMFTEKSYPNQQHTSTFYEISVLIYPFAIVAVARAAKVRWAATLMALTYMAIMCAMIWILPLFSAQPLLAPIYNPVDRMVPPNFPLLLIVPAFAIDLVLQRLPKDANWWRQWLYAVLMAALFFGLFLGCQWFFSKFLISPESSNWFFVGNRQWPYFENMGDAKFRFWNLQRDPLTWGSAGIIFLMTLGSVRLGLWRGNWMSQVRR